MSKLMVKNINLLMYGPQGSGKGTQAKLLATKYGFLHISSGEILRQQAKQNTILGKYLQKQLSTGTLTPINKLMQVFDTVVSKIPKNRNIIFDGFARQITEAKIYLRRIKKLGRHINAVILVDIPADETMKRLSRRVECQQCHTVLILGGKIKLGRNCPKCGGKIIRRTDDEPAAIAKRLRLYRRRTLPVIKYFKREKLLITIDGRQSISKVNKDIVSALRKRHLI